MGESGCDGGLQGTVESNSLEKIQDKEEEVWRIGMDSKSKLRTYRTMKRELETEKYLEEGTAHRGV